VSHYLHKLGIKCHLDALDGSPEMLALARRGNRYEKYICALLYANKPCPELLPNSYDAVIVSGSFINGHLTHQHLHHLYKTVVVGQLN
jgi:hypothetical protein